MGMDWTEEENALLRTHIKEFPFPAEDISRQTGRSVNAVKARAQHIRRQQETIALRGSPGKSNGYGAGARKSPFVRNQPKTSIACLGCSKPFKSWDTTRNRLCPSCGSHSEQVTHHRHSMKQGA